MAKQSRLSKSSIRCASTSTLNRSRGVRFLALMTRSRSRESRQLKSGLEFQSRHQKRRLDAMNRQKRVTSCTTSAERSYELIMNKRLSNLELGSMAIQFPTFTYHKSKTMLQRPSSGTKNNKKKSLQLLSRSANFWLKRSFGQRLRISLNASQMKNQQKETHLRKAE